MIGVSTIFRKGYKYRLTKLFYLQHFNNQINFILIKMKEQSQSNFDQYFFIYQFFQISGLTFNSYSRNFRLELRLEDDPASLSLSEHSLDSSIIKTLFKNMTHLIHLRFSCKVYILCCSSSSVVFELESMSSFSTLSALSVRSKI